MVSEPGKIVLASLFVGAVAIAAYVSQSDKRWLSADELGIERDNASARHTRDDTMTGSVSSGPVAGRNDADAAMAGELQAARKSLQRNDLVSAQVQLNAVDSAHRDDGQVRALQREVEARAEQAQHAPAVAHAGKPARQGSKSARSSSPFSAKTGRSRESDFAKGEHLNRASVSYAKARRAPETGAAAVSTVSTGSASGVAASGRGAAVIASSSSPVPADVKRVSSAPSTPAASPPMQPTQPPISALPSGAQTELTAQAAPAQSAPQFAPSAGSLLKSEGGPKTRAQVRAEIAHARADGSLPAFGNPDPAGPGGAPSRTGALGQ